MSDCEAEESETRTSEEEDAERQEGERPWEWDCNQDQSAAIPLKKENRKGQCVSDPCAKLTVRYSARAARRAPQRTSPRQHGAPRGVEHDCAEHLTAPRSERCFKAAQNLPSDMSKGVPTLEGNEDTGV